MKPFRVAIDTSILEQAQYSFNVGDLNILKKHVDDGIISELLISDIVIEEVKNHFIKNSEDISARISSLINCREFRIPKKTDNENKNRCLQKSTLIQNKKYVKNTKKGSLNS